MTEKTIPLLPCRTQLIEPVADFERQSVGDDPALLQELLG